jgi:glucose/arabinose dehydrogenase
LFETEHGDIGHDEVNQIMAGGNYGWPLVQGDETAPGLIPPLLHSGTDTWAPSGLAYAHGSLYFGGLRGQALYQVKLNEPAVATGATGAIASVAANVAGFQPWFKYAFGRLRDVVVGPDGALYVTTSNLDGRGQPLPGDDKILRVDLRSFAFE